MDNIHFACAKSRLNSRNTWLTDRYKHCEYNLLRGIEQQLYGHLVYLGDTMPEPDLANEQDRVLNLCITVFRPDFHDDGERLAAQEDLSNVTRWWLNNRMWDGSQAGADASSLAWSDAVSCQIPCLVRHGKAAPATLKAWLPEARDGVQEPDRQEDLLWLALGLLATGQHQPALELITHWTAANPASRSAWSAAAVSAAAEFIQPLQQAVLDDRIPDFWLVVHGHAAHLECCIDRLARPNSNRTADVRHRAQHGSAPRLQHRSGAHDRKRYSLAETAIGHRAQNLEKHLVRCRLYRPPTHRRTAHSL